MTPFNRDELDRARTTLEGWTVRPIDPYTLDLLDPRGRGFRLRLDPYENSRLFRADSAFRLVEGLD